MLFHMFVFILVWTFIITKWDTITHFRPLYIWTLVCLSVQLTATISRYICSFLIRYNHYVLMSDLYISDLLFVSQCSYINFPINQELEAFYVHIVWVRTCCVMSELYNYTHSARVIVILWMDIFPWPKRDFCFFLDRHSLLQ